MLLPRPLKGKRLNKMMQAKSVSELYQLQVIKDVDNEQQDNIPEQVKLVLQQYHTVF